MRPRIDLPGTLTATAGLFASVYGFSEAERSGWTDPLTLGFLVGGVATLAVFAAVERRVRNPLLPMRVILDRDRGGSFLAVGISGAGMFGVFLFLTYFLQQNLGYTPVETGLAFLPMTLMIMGVATTVSTKLLGRSPRPLVVAGMAMSALGMVLLTGISADATYLADILPGLLLMGAGMALVIAPGMASATYGVQREDAGVASAMVNTAQQIGGSIGTALLSTVVTSAITGELGGAQPTPEAMQAAAIHGYTTAFWWSAAIFAIGAVVCGLLLRPGVQEADPEAAPVVAH